MGPIHGAIVNYCGHMFGYRNFATPHGDKSKNTLIFDFVTWGELFQNNHHARAMSPNFAARWFEVDPTWVVIRALSWFKIIQLSKSVDHAKQPAPAIGDVVAALPVMVDVPRVTELGGGAA